MIEFSVIAGGMLLAGLACVLWPLWRRAAPESDRRREANITVYHQRHDELQREVAAERITRAHAKQRKDELGALLLADVDDEPAEHFPVSGRRPWLTSVCVAVVFAVAAVGLYGLTGDPRGLQPDTAPDIAHLIGQLEARVSAAPEDLQARSLLARVQLSRREYAAAAQSYAAINARLEEPVPGYLLAEARARVLGHDGVVTDRALGLYEQVLELSPDSAEALWYVGLAQLARGRTQVAESYWQRLLEQDLPEDFRVMVERRLAELRGETPSLQSSN